MSPKRSRGKPRSSPRSAGRDRSHAPSVNKQRSETVRQRWAEARLYAERHGTRARLDRRTVAVKLTSESIVEGARSLFSHKRRLGEGRRSSESKAIPRDAHFRLTLKLPNGQQAQSGDLKLPAGASDADIARAVRRANNGVFRSSTDYDRVEDFRVLPDGTVQTKITGDELYEETDGEEGEAPVEGSVTILIEPERDNEPLLPAFYVAEA